MLITELLFRVTKRIQLRIESEAVIQHFRAQPKTERGFVVVYIQSFHFVILFVLRTIALASEHQRNFFSYMYNYRKINLNNYN